MAAERLRVDKWLWYARFFKSRSIAQAQVTAGHVRVNSQKISKASATIGPGDVLTFPQANHIRVVKVLACGTRRGPAPEAQALYEDMSPPRPEPQPKSPKYDGKGRPTKKDRRQQMASRFDTLE